MPSPRARVDRVPVVVPHVVNRRWLVPALLLGLLLTLAGCGSSGDEAKADAPSKKTVACREKWKALEDKVGDRASRTEPSALAPRWNSIAATISYYANGAKASDCDTAYAAQQKAMADLTVFSAKLRPYDMELRLKLVEPGAEKYAAGPRPKPSPVPKDEKKKKKQKTAPKAPKPSDIGAALKSLTKQAPIATQQQGAGWQQARVVELADKAAVAKTVKDLRFLSSESSGYKASKTALAEIRTAAPFAAY
jgi:hypothetical protein